MADQPSESERNRLLTLRQYDVLDTPAEEAFDRITRLAKSALRAPIALVSLVDAERQWFKSKQGLNVSETPREHSFCAHAIRHDEPFVVSDARLDPRFHDNPLVTSAPNMRFYAGIPLNMKNGYNIGTLCVIDTMPRHLSELEFSMLEDLAQLVVDELELRLMATSDALTGMLTRRSFEKELNGELERMRRYRRDMAIIIFDIDHFKLVNDTYGHAAGDAVLKEIGSTCRSMLRHVDKLARLGGEEFAILMPEVDQAGVCVVAEKIRKKLSTTPVNCDIHSIVFTASFGLAVGSPNGETSHDLLNRADQALFQAKKGGRNRSVYVDFKQQFSDVWVA